MLALADDAALARLLIATAAVIDFSIEGGKAMGKRDDEADPQTKIQIDVHPLGAAARGTVDADARLWTS